MGYGSKLTYSGRQRFKVGEVQALWHLGVVLGVLEPTLATCGVVHWPM